MKVALVHDYIKEYGGAERVLEALHEIFPQAPVFTSIYMPSFLGPHKERFAGWDIRTSFLQYIPFKQKLVSPFRLLSSWVFGQFDLSGYDVVIVSATGAYFPNAIKTKSEIRNPKSETSSNVQNSNDKKTKMERSIQICYCHTPPRYLYGYATARNWKKYRIFAILGGIVNHFLRMVDFEVSRNVDYYVANSEEVAGRIEKFYRRKAIVIYPPVSNEISNFKFQISNEKKLDSPQGCYPFYGVARLRGNDNQRGDYFLAGGRLARAKHTDLIVRACEELGVALKVFGRGFGGYEIKDQRSKIKAAVQSSKIEFVGEVSDEEKYELMKNAKAFIFAGEDEDFGIVPVEAMSAGIPLIAYKSGGVKETVIDGKTGVFFDELSVEGLKKAVQRFETLRQAQGKILSENCRKQAERFGKERFKREIREFISAKIKDQKSKLQVKS